MKSKLAIVTVFAVLISYAAFSQQPVTLTVKVKALAFKKKGALPIKHPINAVFKFYSDTALPLKFLSKNGCFSLKTAKDTVYEFADSIAMAQSVISDSIVINPATDTAFKLVMENYSSLTGDPCTYKKGDELHTVSSTIININSIKPGLFSDTVWVRSAGFSACLQVRYGLAAPSFITTSADTVKQNLVNRPFTLKCDVAIKNTDSLKYVWEFSTDDSKTWQLLADTVKNNIVVQPEKDIFKNALKKPAVVNIRFSVKTSQVSSRYVYRAVAFTPPPPLIDTAQIKIQYSCPDKKSGTISVNNIVGTTGSYRYFLRKGKNNYKNCAESMAKPCAEAIVKSFFSDSAFAIENVPAGDFTLIVLNDGFDVGDNYSWANISVPEYPRLRVSSKKIRPANCSNGYKGSILLTLAGNNASELRIDLFPTNSLDMRAFNDTVFVPNLKPGTYSIKLGDDCAQVDTAYNMVVAEDIKNTVAAVTVLRKPDSTALNSGVLHIHVAEGPSLFSYKISRDNLPVLYDSTKSNDVMVGSLSAGRYVVSLADAINRTCSGFDTSFIVPYDADNNIYRNIQYNSFDSAVENMPFDNTYLLVINKTDYLLKLYKNNQCTAVYPVTFGSGELSNKKIGGDLKTPEGLYTIVSKSTDSKFGEFFLLDYPTKENYTTFNTLKQDSAIPTDAVISDKIGLHGTPANAALLIDERQSFTNGSIALKNKDIEELYNLLPPGTKVLVLNR